MSWWRRARVGARPEASRRPRAGRRARSGTVRSAGARSEAARPPRCRRVYARCRAFPPASRRATTTLPRAGGEGTVSTVTDAGASPGRKVCLRAEVEPACHEREQPSRRSPCHRPSRRMSAASDGNSAASVSGDPISKSSNSNPGATVQPQSTASPSGSAACHTPAGTTACGVSRSSRSGLRCRAGRAGAPRRRSDARPRRRAPGARCSKRRKEQVVNGGGGAATGGHPGRVRSERAAEGLAVEAALGMRPQAQAPHHVVGIQRSPLTSARGGGRRALRPPATEAAGDLGPVGERPLGEAEMLVRGVLQPGGVAPARCPAAPGGASPWRS